MAISENQILILDDNEYIDTDIIELRMSKIIKEKDQEFDLTVCHNPNGFVATKKFLDYFITIQNLTSRVLLITDYAPFQNIKTFANFSVLAGEKLNEGDEPFLKYKEKAIAFAEFLKNNRTRVFIVLNSGINPNEWGGKDIKDDRGELTPFGEVHTLANKVIIKKQLKKDMQQAVEAFCAHYKI
ncbi:MAG: hypothetical protein OEL89_02335 [Candidatus Peregrinibacteria bacterium]|nr:hypothetical protein [Candidatus Peregrinibacteria bacterium]